MLLKNGIDSSGVNRKRLRQEPVSLGIVALSLFMEPLFRQSPGVRRYGLGIAGPHIVILQVVVHMDLPHRDNSPPHRLLRDPLHKAARNWSASPEADQGILGTGGRSVIATRFAQETLPACSASHSGSFQDEDQPLLRVSANLNRSPGSFYSL
ncbi:hypothetical protein [Skermanella pratensis]|uniref:hypothetical protein n=1 Tax=Skermanella pratensis TaxID=2233999 RepID=UPI0013015F04|nr:hypothetical protein [Skermanella pratensis]